MKTKLFYSLSLLLLITILLSSCKKEKLDDKKTTDNSTALSANEKQNAITNLKMYPTGGSSPLAYMGDGLWQGTWSGVVLTFQGPLNTQLNDGNLHWYTPVSANNGLPYTGLSQIDGRSFTLTIAVISGTTTMQLPFVSWVKKGTGTSVDSGLPYVCPSFDYFQVIGSYSGFIYDLGSGIKTTSCDIMIVQVDNHLELCSYVSGGSGGILYD